MYPSNAPGARRVALRSFWGGRVGWNDNWTTADSWNASWLTGWGWSDSGVQGHILKLAGSRGRAKRPSKKMLTRVKKARKSTRISSTMFAKNGNARWKR